MEQSIEIYNLNVLKKIRLKIWQQKKNINIQKYNKLPEYIKFDDTVIEKIIKEFNLGKISEEDLFLIPISKINDYINKGYDWNENIDSNIIELDKLTPDSVIKILEFDISKFDKLLISQRRDICLNIIDNWENENGLFRKICNRNNKRKFAEQKGDEEFERLFIDVLKINYPDEYTKILSENINEFSFSVQENLIRKNPALLSSILKENQMKFLTYTDGRINQEKLKKNLKYATPALQEYCMKLNGDISLSNMQYTSTEIQNKYIQENIRNLRNASLDVIKKYVKDNPENLKYVSAISAAKIVNENLELFDKMSVLAKKHFMTYNEGGHHLNRISEVLQNDIKNIRYYDCTCLGYYGNTERINVRDVEFDFGDYSNKTDSEIKNIFFQSKILDAYGNISSYDSMHNIYATPGIVYDFRSKKVKKELNKLNLKQVAELIKIDSNYILPYIEPQEWKYSSEEINNSKDRTKKLFIELYGKDKFDDYEKFIDDIFAMQEIYKYDNKDFTKKTKLPVHELKILFNQTIINTDGINNLYKDYFTKIKEGKDASLEFINIIENVYGEDAKKILESRPGLDIHEINSLEVFDNRIKSIFEGKDWLSYESFVHNCLSYNIENFSGFLDIIKNEEKNKRFSTYYEIIATIMGDNVETAQRAITQFDYVEEILNSVNDIELTEKQEQNLLSVLCSYKNPCNITSIEELEGYEEKLFLEESLSSKEFAFKLHFGISRVLDDILYDISDEELKKYEYTNSEECMLKVAKYCLESYNYLDIYKNTPSNPIALYSAIDRTRQYQMEIFNSRLLNREKLDKMIEESKDKESPSIYVTTKDEIKTYHIMVDKKTRKLPRSSIKSYRIWKY